MAPEIKDQKEVDDGVVHFTDPKTDGWRGRCGCLRTSDKLRQILSTFPSPPPPSPVTCEKTCVVAFWPQAQEFCPPIQQPEVLTTALVKRSTEPLSESFGVNEQEVNSKSWRVVFELVQLVQLSVTATALALYYLIYCYMQLVYYTLRSALYFHQADGPMKVTIGVVTLTSLVVGFNVIMRIEKIIRIV